MAGGPSFGDAVSGTVSFTNPMLRRISIVAPESTHAGITGRQQGGAISRLKGKSDSQAKKRWSCRKDDFDDERGNAAARLGVVAARFTKPAVPSA